MKKIMFSKNQPRGVTCHSAPVQKIDRIHILPIITSFVVGAYAACQFISTPPIAPSDDPSFITSRYRDYTVFVNTKKIRWMEHNSKNNCFYLCTDSRVCFNSEKVKDKYVVCETEYPKSYKKLDNFVSSID